MKKVVLIIMLIFSGPVSDAQVVKSFEYVKSYEDSLISVYSVRIRLDRQADNNTKSALVKNELMKRVLFQSERILQIEEGGHKKFLTFNYRVRVAKK